jgi:CheY-like chemotaxis protein
MLSNEMNGNISFESELGKGSEFKVILPLKKALFDDVIIADEDELNEMESLKILLVEDDISNAKFMKRLLERLGHIVDTAENGVIAVNKVMEKKFDMILMDIQLPEMDGIEATDVIKNKLMIKDIPIIAITAYARDEDKQKIISEGLDAYVSKPISIKKLKEVIEKNRVMKNDISNDIIEHAFEIKESKKNDRMLNISEFELPIKNKDYDLLEERLNELKEFFNNEKDKKNRNIIFKSIMALRRKDLKTIEENLMLVYESVGN